jgi:Bacteriophage lambda head decoration protein D
MHPYETARLPLVYYEKGFDFRKVRLSSRPIPIPAAPQAGPSSTLFKIMPTYTLPSNLGDILGAHHDGNFETVTAEIKAGIGKLKRGTVLVSGSGADAGKLVLTAAGNEATAFGILLDPEIDTAVAFTDGTVSGSVARAGTFRGAALIVSTGVNVATLTDTLRKNGIFTEGPIVASA